MTTWVIVAIVLMSVEVVFQVVMALNGGRFRTPIEYVVDSLGAIVMIIWGIIELWTYLNS